MRKRNNKAFTAGVSALVLAGIAGTLAVHSNHQKFLIGSVAGGLLGAVAALLLAPKSGEELIEDITSNFQLNGVPKKRKRHRMATVVRAKKKKEEPA